MRLATLRTEDGHRAVRIENDGMVLLPWRDLGELLERPTWREDAQADGETRVLDIAQLAPVVPRPQKVFVVGFNFPDSDLLPTPPEFPSIFAKFARSLCGPRDALHLPDPSISTQGDFEVEPVAVIGKAGRHIPLDKAAGHIAGYCVGNDASVRDWQFRNRPPLIGKAWEGMTPVGPWMTTADAVDLASLRMTCEVDGVTMQDGAVSEMIFSPEHVVSYISTLVTLDPGDLIFLGTPPGHAFGRESKPWLTEGQTVRAAITGLGDLVNTCVADPVLYQSTPHEGSPA
ncbi:fumarylacetoacetate hydrolase family protein [Janibacter sp. G1551]|uniref:fumarylacetoacetate hydrolase family protein n=1 Tax=Janibacter sp. G1551 TaxID=3420440 RepID=UPI003CFE5364